MFMCLCVDEEFYFIVVDCFALIFDAFLLAFLFDLIVVRPAPFAQISFAFPPLEIVQYSESF